MMSRNLFFTALVASLSFAQTTTSTTTPSATACATATVLQAYPTGLHCGQYGKLGAPVTLGDATTASSLEDCGGLCLSNSGCRSIGFSKSSSSCQLYGRRLINQEYTDLTDDLGTVFYGRACFSCSSSDDSSTSPSSSTSTSLSVNSASQTTSSASNSAITSSAITPLANVKATSTSTLTLTTTITTTTYPSATAIADCLSVTQSNTTWYLYHAGSGASLATDNPGNDQSDIVKPVQTYLNGTFTTDCDAVKACAAGASAAPPDTYWSFDLHWAKNMDMWECILYYDGNDNATYYSVVDANIGAAYGFTYAP